MLIRRFVLGAIGFSVAISMAGCAEKAVPTAMERSVKQDRQISDAILEKFRKDNALSDNLPSFQILTVKGETTLYGVVNNELERGHAEQVAAETKGVTGVTSRIRLKHQPVQTATASAR